MSDEPNTSPKNPQPIYSQPPPINPPYGYGQQPPMTQFVPVGVPVRNGAAMAGLILGIIGFLFTPIPFFVGFFLGGIPNILAIIFSIVALNRSGRLGGLGRVPAVWGLVLGSLGFLSIFIGAGTLW